MLEYSMTAKYIQNVNYDLLIKFLAGDGDDFKTIVYKNMSYNSLLVEFIKIQHNLFKDLLPLFIEYISLRYTTRYISLFSKNVSYIIEEDNTSFTFNLNAEKLLGNSDLKPLPIEEIEDHTTNIVSSLYYEDFFEDSVMQFMQRFSIDDSLSHAPFIDITHTHTSEIETYIMNFVPNFYFVSDTYILDNMLDNQ